MKTEPREFWISEACELPPPVPYVDKDVGDLICEQSSKPEDERPNWVKTIEYTAYEQLEQSLKNSQQQAKNYANEIERQLAIKQQLEQRVKELTDIFESAFDKWQAADWELNQIKKRHNLDLLNKRIEKLDEAEKLIAKYKQQLAAKDALLIKAHKAISKIDKFGYGVNIESLGVITNTETIAVDAANDIAKHLGTNAEKKEKGE